MNIYHVYNDHSEFLLSFQPRFFYLLRLQDAGALNINLVTPTPQVPMIFSAIELAKNYGLTLPIVYNTGGYDSVEVLQLLEGMVDIYMPDFKYSSNENGLKYSGIIGYFDIAKSAIKEMHRQVGDLVINKRGTAVKGLLIRHLVLPNDLAGTKTILEYIAKEISIHTYVNIMAQYRPAYRAFDHKALNKGNISAEYKEAIDYARKLGLHHGF